MPPLRFQWARIDGLSARAFHAAIALREAVFVVEQQCVFQDADAYDLQCWHLLAWSGDDLAAYLRVVDPGGKFAEPSVGRVVNAAAFRGQGVGRALMAEAVARCQATWPGEANRIGAQQYLLDFYASFGFVPVGDAYLEDGIPHVEMLRPGGR
jgi:ElaA protein